jgi:hypothetical protein
LAPDPTSLIDGRGDPRAALCRRGELPLAWLR